MAKKKPNESYAAMGPLPSDGPPKAKIKKEDASRAAQAAQNEPPPSPMAPPPDNAGEAYAAKGPSPTAKRFVAKDAKDAWDKIMEAGGELIGVLLLNNKDGIADAYTDSIEDIDDDKKQKYNVGISLSITGDDPNHYSVSAKVSYSRKYTDSDQCQVAVGADLVDQMEAASNG